MFRKFECSLIGKRIHTFLLNSSYYSWSIALLLCFLYPWIMCQLLGYNRIYPLYPLLLLLYCYGTSLISGFLLLPMFIDVLFCDVNQNTRITTLEMSMWILFIILLRSLFTAIYEVKHDGYSKGSKTTGIKVTELDGTPCKFHKFFFRNLVIFSGGFMFYFLICIPFFNKGSKSLLDKLLKISVIECKEDNKKVKSFLDRFLQKAINH